MQLKYFLFAIVVVILSTASFMFVNNNFGSQRGRVVISDADVLRSASGAENLANEQARAAQPSGTESISTQGETAQSSTRMLGDLSKVTTTIDGLGNRIETRVFERDPRLRMVMVQIAADGMVRAFVYGHLGGVKTLTGAEAKGALTSTAGQLAETAGIYETRLDKERRKPDLARRVQSELSPIPSSEIPIRSQNLEAPKETVVTRTAKKSADAES